MVTKATVSYIDKDKIQNCVTGRIIKSTEDSMVIHPNDEEGSALRFNKERMKGSILESSSSGIKNISIIEYSTWTFNSEIHFLLPNKIVENEDEIIISGMYNSRETASGNKIKIETDDTLFRLNYDTDTNSWQLNKDFVVESKLYDFDMYCSPNRYRYIFYIGTNNCEFRDLAVNSIRI